MKFVFQPHPSKLATLIATFNAGSRVEYKTDFPKGISHFMEHLRFQGSKNYTSKQLARTIAQAGGSSNAYTSEDMVSYFISLPQENAETAFACLSDIALRPVFPEKNIEKEKEVVCQEVRMYQDDMSWLVHYKAMDLMFNNSLNNEICGTEESVRSITRKDLMRFNKKFYTRDDLLLVYCGPADHENLASDLACKYFGKSNGVLNQGPKFRNGKPGKETGAVVKKEDQMQDTILMSYTQPKFASMFKNRSAELATFSVLFGRGEMSRLFSRIRDDLGLVYGIDCSYDELNDGAWFAINTMTEPANLSKVLSNIHKEADRIVKTPPKKQEVESAKNMIRSSIYSIESSYGTASQIMQREMFGKKIGDDFIQDVNKVSAQDIQNVAKDIFSAQQYLVIGTGKSETVGE